QSVRSDWRQRKAGLPSQASDLTEAHVSSYERGLEGFVGQVNTYVALLQESTATKLGRYHLSLMGFTLLGLVLGLVTFQRTRHFLSRPLQSLRDCASRIATGDLAGCRAPRAETEEIDQLAVAFNHMARELTTLKHNLDTQVAEQTRSLQQRNQRLTMLYEIATSLQTNLAVEELLDQALDGVVSVTESSAGIARLVTDDGRMRLVASRGLDPEVLEDEQLVPLDRCLCGHSAVAGELRFRGDLAPCEGQLGTSLPCSGEGGLFAVPIKYKGQVLGLFTLFGTPRQGSPQEGIESLLETVANHVGLAIENRRLATEAQRTALMEERNLLASELHDSIAQCLASVKLQIWMLEQEVAKGDLERIRELVPKIRGGVEAGYGNLRELLTHFRTKIDERGLIPALKGLTSGFQERTGLTVYLQGANHNPEIGPDDEVMREAAEFLLDFLIEDDGAGMDVAAVDGDERAHFGLSIMRERAARLNGQLEIESDPGEGTRVTLSFPRPGAGGTDAPATTEEAGQRARISG
ncbi:MAG: GAF domain-containing protein, partial [Thiohalorhabdaceae bacterium]